MIFIFIVGSVAVIIGTVINMDSDEYSHKSIALIFVIAGSLLVGVAIAKDNGYKQGQIDALKGKYKYEMQIQQDTVYIKK